MTQTFTTREQALSTYETADIERCTIEARLDASKRYRGRANDLRELAALTGICWAAASAVAAFDAAPTTTDDEPTDPAPTRPNRIARRAFHRLAARTHDRALHMWHIAEWRSGELDWTEKAEQLSDDAAAATDAAWSATFGLDADRSWTPPEFAEQGEAVHADDAAQQAQYNEHDLAAKAHRLAARAAV